ncbi:hypothetical protein BDV09DRAFT_175368 [Aspergillus tetrazonus]
MVPTFRSHEIGAGIFFLTTNSGIGISLAFLCRKSETELARMTQTSSRPIPILLKRGSAYIMA